MANGTITESFLRQILSIGFNSQTAVLVAKDSGNNPLASESFTFNNASDGSITTPTIVLNLSQDDVVTKLELQTTGGTVLWDITQTFDFTQAGTLTVSLTFNLNQTGTNASDFESGANTYILANGMAGRTLTFTFFDSSEAAHESVNGTVAGAGSISSSSSEASVGLSANVTGNMVAPVDIRRITISASSPSSGTLIDLPFPSPVNYEFQENGTLTFTDLTFIVSV